MICRQPEPSAEIEQFARAIFGQSENPVLLGHARVIATNELVLRAIDVQKIAVVERLREPTTIALAKGDNSIELATARFHAGLAGPQGNRSACSQENAREIQGSDAASAREQGATN